MKNSDDPLLCTRPRCRNLKRKGHQACHKCQKREWRAAHPMRAAYCNLRDHAKERGIPFTISFAEFETFALESNYLNATGNGGSCLTVDRIDNLKGYEPGNIQALTRSANLIKKAKSDEIRMKKGYGWQ